MKSLTLRIATAIVAFSSLMGAVDATACAAGTYSATGTGTCTPCPAGTYSNSAGSLFCPACAPGTFSGAPTSTLGATSCTACATNYYSIAGASSCFSSCPAGTYPSGGVCQSCGHGTSSAGGVTQCTACASNTYTNSLIGATACVASTNCPSGSIFSSTAASCVLCPANTFSNKGVCSPCAANTYAPQGSVASTQCVACGTTSPPGVSIQCGKFYYNGVITKSIQGYVSGLWMNARLIQGVYDYNTTNIPNPDPNGLFHYPDSKKWDPARNTNEFVANMNVWKSYGLNGFTVGLQGGSVLEGESSPDGLHSLGFSATGVFPNPLDNKAGTNTASRLKLVLDEAIRLNMIPTVSLFYGYQITLGVFGSTPSTTITTTAVNNFLQWAISNGYQHKIMIEVKNECSGSYASCGLDCTSSGGGLINYMQQVRGAGFLIGNSLLGGCSSMPSAQMMANQDVIFVHGNGCDLGAITSAIGKIKLISGYSANKPIVINEGAGEDGEDGQTSPADVVTLAKNYSVSSGLYDQGKNNYKDGFQSLPVNWSPTSAGVGSYKYNFFTYLKSNL